MMKTLFLVAVTLVTAAPATAGTYTVPGTSSLVCKASLDSWKLTQPASVGWRWVSRTGAGHDVFGSVKFNADGKSGSVHIAPYPGKGYCLVSSFKS